MSQEYQRDWYYNIQEYCEENDKTQVRMTSTMLVSIIKCNVSTSWPTPLSIGFKDKEAGTVVFQIELHIFDGLETKVLQDTMSRNLKASTSIWPMESQKIFGN